MALLLSKLKYHTIANLPHQRRSFTSRYSISYKTEGRYSSGLNYILPLSILSIILSLSLTIIILLPHLSKRGITCLRMKLQ